MAEIKTARWTPVDTYTHSERPIMIKQQAFHDISSSRVTLKNFSGSSLIKHIQIKCNDSYPSIS